MIIFLYGPDTYRSGQKLKEIILRYKDIHKTGMSFNILEGEKGSFDDFKRAAETVSMFEEKKLVVLKDFLAVKSFSDSFLTWGGRTSLKNSKDAICVFMDGVTDKKSSLYAWLLRNGQCQEFIILQGPALLAWTKLYLAKRGIAMEQGAVQQLIAHTGGDLWALRNSVEQLSSYKSSDPSATITQEDLNVFLRPALQTNIFNLVDSVASGDRSRAFRLLAGHIEAGDSPNYIFSMTHQQFKNIAMAFAFYDSGKRGAATLASEANLHPYVAKKSLAFASKIGRDNIKKIYNRLADLDLDMKLGKLEPQEALQMLISGT